MKRRSFLKGILGASAVAIAPKALTEVDKGLLIEPAQTTNYDRSLSFSRTITKPFPFDGHIKSFRMYDRALTVDEVGFLNWEPIGAEYKVGDVVIDSGGKKWRTVEATIGKI